MPTNLDFVFRSNLIFEFLQSTCEEINKVCTKRSFQRLKTSLKWDFFGDQKNVLAKLIASISMARKIGLQ